MAPSKKITINPLSRIEGHGKVTIHLDENGDVCESRFHVTQFRGYERFCQGRPFEEMPVLTQRICGICPVSHQLASAKACDAILGVVVPPTARRLRELLHMGQFIQSHALHFFHLASPDLLLGWDADPGRRNVVGLMAAFPDLAMKGIRLRKFGQEIIKALGGKKIHPAFAVPGGVMNPLKDEDRGNLLSGFSDAYASTHAALGIVKEWLGAHGDEVAQFANFPSIYAGLVDEKGCPALYDGNMRMRGHDGGILAEFEPAQYLGFIAEHVEPWSYLKFPVFKPLGYPTGCYRVGPLGRLNVVDAMGTFQAQAAFDDYRQRTANGLKGGSLFFHYARLIELLYCLEKAETLLEDERICGRDIRISSNPAHREGVGVIEAPRGTLIHHYRVDKYGILEAVNLIVATGHNNLAMNRSVDLVARACIRGGEVREGMLNRIEGAIRCYDPCLSCSTHAVGQMPLVIDIFSSTGARVKTLGST
ncbi:Ni/Fe hydrogenase subunit alpha [uncultured Desulfosarcina sp.]|uniref:Ni/Fe hydrogenase subunit alpha n=1 Tax=uncultured Desulfosarcina sp. TaxID=218289 RepID=UPI0029C87AA1|nr:Ni/Fe hydrogenase subunit alpha [uncultured Desulfosarcina sp.]